MMFEQKARQLSIILFFLMVSVLPGQAQTNMVFYPTENQINSPSLNPAFLTSQNKFTLSVFPLSGLNVGYNNQLVIKNMLFNILKGKQTQEDFKAVFNSMVKLDLFYQRMENNLLSFGYNSRFGSFDFRVKENMQLMADLKGDFSELVTNTSLLTFSPGKQQTFPAIALYYREYSMGFAKDVVREKLTVGLRVKLYFGKSSMSSDVRGEQVVNGTNSIGLSTSGTLKISTPLQIVTDDDGVLTAVELADGFTVGNFLMNSKNTGAGFDIGLNYKPTPDLALSASLVDVGAIKWNNNLNTMRFNGSGKIELGPNSSTSQDFDQLYKIELENTPFSTRLPTTIYAGLKYRANSQLNLSLVDRFVSTRSMSFNSLSVTGIYDVKKNLSISSGYSIIGNSFSNFPFAVLYTGETGQYYIGTDNLLSMVVPSASDFSGITFGMCFFLFRGKVKYKQQPEYLPFYKEKKRNLVN
jgi:hypothetical protein